MKKLSLILIFLVFKISYSQKISTKEITKLNTFGLNLDIINLESEQNYDNLKSILQLDKKRKKSKTVGIIFSSLGIATSAYGIWLFSENKNEQEGVGQSIGIIAMVAGTIELGVSVPLFISSNKRKKERDKLIQLYRE